MADRLLSARRVSVAVGVLLLAQPVAAQTGIDFLRSGVCGNRGATLLAAAWAGFTIYFAVFGLYRVVTGMSKTGSSDPSVQTEGRERIKGSGWSFGSAFVLLSAERVLAFIGIPVFSCINLGIM